MVRRACVAVIAGLTLAGGSGCHLGPQPRGIKTEPPAIRRDPAAQRFIEQHNRNADAITALRAEPSVQVAGMGMRGHANGQLALERDRYFCLDLYALGHHKASIGSNPEEFWFWLDEDKDKAVNFCNYRDVARSPLALSYQPDWIMEAMGLRPISAAEATTLHVRAGETPGTMILTQTRQDARRQTYTKETVVDEARGRILEHRLWMGVKQELLARARIDSYNETRFLDGAASDSASTSAAAATPVYIPDKFRLEWVQEKMALDIQLKPSRSDFKVNPTFSDADRAKLFAEPTPSGTVRRDLARLDAGPGAAPTADLPPKGGAQVRTTRPIPSGGISLGDPIPDAAAPGDGAVRTSIEADPVTPDPAGGPATGKSSLSPTGWSPRRRISNALRGGSQ